MKIEPAWSINVTERSTPEDRRKPAADGLTDRDDQTNRPQQDFRPTSKGWQGRCWNNRKTESSPLSTSIFGKVIVESSASHRLRLAASNIRLEQPAPRPA